MVKNWCSTLRGLPLQAMDDSQGIPDTALRSALEFAVGIAAAGAKLRPPLPFPAALKSFTRFHRLPPKALGAVRAAVEADPTFRERLGIAATSDLVDELGCLWLQRPHGWLERATELAEGPAEPEGDDDSKSERRRREAAEAAAARSRLEVVELREALVAVRAELAQAQAELKATQKDVAGLRSRLAETERGAARSDAGRQRATGTAEQVRREAEELRSELESTQQVLQDVLRRRAEEPPAIDAERMRGLLLEALSMVGGASATGRRPRRRSARTPIPVPGGLLNDSEAVAEHLLRSPGVLVLVDGYNIAKAGWPDLVLERQRDQCVRVCEQMAVRWGTDVQIVFDGADVVGAHSSERRLVKVSYSPSGVLADDVLRATVAATDPARQVVVVTSDQAVANDVRAEGANTIRNDMFLAVARR